MNTRDFNKLAADQRKQNQQFYKRLKAKPPRNLDALFNEAHEKVFAETDCLTCGNCCKTTSPIFYQRDIERAAKAVRLKPGEFIDKYLMVDEDKDYVLKQSPCIFLDHENYCTIYADRPTACREYPHTNRKRMVQILDLTYKNTLVCPAVLEITEKLREKLGV
jgi:Fe-S-cluster containining protein